MTSAISDFGDLKRVLAEDFRWYFSVMDNEMPAKYLIAKRVEAKPGGWEELDKLTDSFLKLWRDVREGKEDIRKLEVPRYSLLDYLSDLVELWLESCGFCRWNCRVNRKVRAGACQLNVESRVASYFHHGGRSSSSGGSTARARFSSRRAT